MLKIAFWSLQTWTFSVGGYPRPPNKAPCNNTPPPPLYKKPSYGPAKWKQKWQRKIKENFKCVHLGDREVRWIYGLSDCVLFVVAQKYFQVKHRLLFLKQGLELYLDWSPPPPFKNSIFTLKGHVALEDEVCFYSQRIHLRGWPFEFWGGDMGDMVWVRFFFPKPLVIEFFSWHTMV